MGRGASDIFAPILAMLTLVIGVGVWHELTGGEEARDFPSHLARAGDRDAEDQAPRRPSLTDEGPTLAARAYDAVSAYFWSDGSAEDDAQDRIALAEDPMMVVGAEDPWARSAATDPWIDDDRWGAADEWRTPEPVFLVDLGPRRIEAAEGVDGGGFGALFGER